MTGSGRLLSSGQGLQHVVESHLIRLGFEVEGANVRQRAPFLITILIGEIEPPIVAFDLRDANGIGTASDITAFGAYVEKYPTGG